MNTNTATLVLTRKRGETIVIDGNIRVTVHGIDGGNKVRLRIEAPRDVPVNRQEVQDAIEGKVES